MEFNIYDLINYIMALLPSIISVITVFSSIAVMIKNFKKVINDDVTDMKALKKEYKQLNQTCKAVLEENKKLKDTIEEQAKNFELIALELNKHEEEEQVQ